MGYAVIPFYDGIFVALRFAATHVSRLRVIRAASLIYNARSANNTFRLITLKVLRTHKVLNNAVRSPLAFWLGILYICGEKITKQKIICLSYTNTLD